jgi:glucose-6-phosphate isomerase
MEISDKTTFFEPFGVEFDLEKGEMLDYSHSTVRHASDMVGHYENEDALKKLIDEYDDPLHYEVFEKPVPQEAGHIMYAISKLQPGLVGDEFYMTKGHYHTVLDTAELYLCLGGEGYMIMKTREDQFHAEKMVRGRMVYVPPFWAHRSVNTGSVPLISFCVYRGDAGHNYGDILEEGFIKRVKKINGKVVIE